MNDLEGILEGTDDNDGKEDNVGTEEGYKDVVDGDADGHFLDTKEGAFEDMTVLITLPFTVNSVPT